MTKMVRNTIIRLISLLWCFR